MAGSIPYLEATNSGLNAKTYFYFLFVSGKSYRLEVVSWEYWLAVDGDVLTFIANCNEAMKIE